MTLAFCRVAHMNFWLGKMFFPHENKRIVWKLIARTTSLSRGFSFYCFAFSSHYERLLRVEIETANNDRSGASQAHLWCVRRETNMRAWLVLIPFELKLTCTFQFFYCFHFLFFPFFRVVLIVVVCCCGAIGKRGI